MELWDALNERGEKLGFTIERGSEPQNEVFHAVVEVAAIDENGRILLTQRDARKYFGLRWEITAGSSLAGETPEEGAARELWEETGIRVSPDKLIPMHLCYQTYVEEHPRDNCLTYSYLAPFCVGEQTITMQEGETVSYRFLTKQEFWSFTKATKSFPCRRRESQRFRTSCSLI